MSRDTHLSRRTFGTLSAAAAVAAVAGTAGTARAQTTGGTATPGGATGGGAIAFEDLIQEHRQISDHLSGMASAQDSQQRMRMVQELKTMLTKHAVAEENALYPALQVLAGAESEAEEMYRQHAHMKVDLYELEMAAAQEGGGDYAQRLQELTETITSHVEEEEGEIFPSMQDALEQAQLQRVEEQLAENENLVR